MRIGGSRRSSNIEDRRGQSFGGPIAIGGGGVGIVVVILALLFGVNPADILGPGAVEDPSAVQTQPGQTGPRADDELADFSSAVLASTEDVWGRLLAPHGGYREPTLVLFDGQTDAGQCGVGQAAMGPFYCPPDQKLYVDLSFYRQLAQRFGAPGDFAQAYVIAHEVGHHVQTLMGTSQEATAAMRRANSARANQISVRLELQADCYAGVWAHHARTLLEAGDVEEGLTAAAAIGDDALTGGRVRPESFTHGSSEQRVRWFRIGQESGRIESCDTFSAPNV